MLGMTLSEIIHVHLWRKRKSGPGAAFDILDEERLSGRFKFRTFLYFRTGDDARRETQIVAGRLIHAGIHGRRGLARGVRLAPGIDQTLIMLGVLEIAFGQNTVAHRRRILGKSLIFLANLIGSATNADFWPVTVKDLHPGVAAARSAAPVATIATPAIAAVPSAPS